MSLPQKQPESSNACLHLASSLACALELPIPSSKTIGILKKTNYIRFPHEKYTRRQGRV